MCAFQPIIGTWWIAGKPDEPVAGYLDRRASRDSAPWCLTLHGELSGPPRPPGLVQYISIHGRTPSGLFTLMGASFREGPSGLTDAEIKKTVWDGWQLLHGAHVDGQERYTKVTFQVPGLWHWLGPTGLNAHMRKQVHTGAAEWARPTPGQPGRRLIADIGSGIELGLGPTYAQVVGRSRQSMEYHAQYSLASATGIDLDCIERISLALTNLHAIVTGTPMDAFGMRLVTSADQELQSVDGKHPHGRRWGKSGLADPFFDTAEVEFASFMPRWLELCREVPVAIGAAAPRDDRRFVQGKLIDSCNGLEALASHKWGKPVASTRDAELLARLKECGLNREFRDSVKLTLQMQRFPLRKKLQQLAHTIGEESAAWLLGTVPVWADLIADFRNSLTHGFALDGGLGYDIDFVLMAEESATAVLRLALLEEAGYKNACSPKPGELLRHGGQTIAGHPNSLAFDKLNVIAHHSECWPQWKRIRDSARATRDPGKNTGPSEPTEG